ncbi:MAG: glycosyltransferase family 2 protein, partial [Myxococcaceae bacterium]
VRRGEKKLTGNSLCTGNASMRRADYLAVGGFDPAFGRSEDSELGLRLQKAGVELVFCYPAHTFHGSDHTRLDVWLRRAFLYGVFDSRIARKHRDLTHASPFRYLFRMNPLARPLLGAALTFPKLTRPVSDSVLYSALALDKVGLEKAALRALAVAYAMEYFRGVRDELGSWAAAARDLARHARDRKRSE